MKIRLKRIALYPAALILLIALVLFAMWKPTRIDEKPARINEKTFARVNPGMSQSQVEAILGGPPVNYDSSQRNDVVGMVRVKEWHGNDGFIRVTFDAQDRAVSAYLVSDDASVLSSSADFHPPRWTPPRKSTTIERWLGFALW